MTRSRCVAHVLLGWMFAAVMVGCSQKATNNPVHGKVLFQGQPLAGALVSFHPDDGKLDPATGMTKEDGTFTVMTGDVEGAKSGSYKVTIMCQVPVETKTTGLAFGDLPETVDRLKGAYANRDTSQITVTIKDGTNQLEPFELK